MKKTFSALSMLLVSLIICSTTRAQTVNVSVSPKVEHQYLEGLTCNFWSAE